MRGPSCRARTNVAAPSARGCARVLHSWNSTVAPARQGNGRLSLARIHHHLGMNYELDPDWALDFLLARSAVTEAERIALARRAGSGELVRVVRGAYLPQAIHQAHGPRRRHRDLVGARVLTDQRPALFSHSSAAALWRLPRIGPWPQRVDVLADLALGGRSTPGIRRHSEGMVDGDVIDGIPVTTLARTVVDLARIETWENAIVAADAALAMQRFGRAPISLNSADLLRELSRAPRRGSATALRMIDFSDPRSGSPGESLSRISIARARLSPPVLQQRFDDDLGTMYTDFFWPACKVIGEFDGVGKYLRQEWTDGRTPAQVVIDEKWREDRLRRLGPRVVRWGWDVARTPGALARLLRSVGVY